MISKNTSELPASVYFLYEATLQVRRSLLSELEKICNTFFSTSIDYSTLTSLTAVASDIQKKFTEDIQKVICQKLTEGQLLVVGREILAKMVPHRGAMITVDDLLLNWAGGYYQYTYQALKTKLESDSWVSVDLEDKVADHLEFIAHLGKPHSEEDSFYIVKKQVRFRKEQYYLSASFVALIEAVYSFMVLIFKEKTAQYQLSTSMIKLIIVITLS